MDLWLLSCLTVLAVLIAAFIYQCCCLGPEAVVVVVGDGAIFPGLRASESFLGVWGRDVLCKRGRLFLIDGNECKRMEEGEMIRLFSGEELAKAQSYLASRDWKVCVARNNDLARRAKARIDRDRVLAAYVRLHPELIARDYEPVKTDDTFIVP